MANAANLVNFGSGGASIGDWTYSAYSLTTPSYLPLNDETASYLASSYPTLAALYTTPVTAYSATARTLPASKNWSGVAFGNGIFVGITYDASAGNVITSTDGINWTSRTLWFGGAGGAGTTSISPQGIYFGNGVFVVTAINANSAGNGTQVFTSVDGINWNYIVIAATATAALYPIYSNGYWLLITGGASYRSVDNGATWISFTPAGVGGFVGRTYGAGKFVGGGHITSTSAISYSSDNGLNWTAATTPSGTYGSITYGNGIFVAVDTGGVASTVAASSPDGVTWTARTLPSSSIWRSVVFGNGVFVALSSTSTNAATSTDGITWTARTLPTSGVTWNGLCFGGPTSNKFFVAIGSGTSNALNINYSVAQTTFSLPVVPPMRNTVPYIKAT